MSDYNVYLGNPARLTYPWKALVDEVHRLLAPVTGFTYRIKKLRVRSTMGAPLLMQGEVLVYVVRSQLSSVIGRKLGTHPEPGHGGLTHMEGAFAASEAYIQGTDTPTLAKIICHELLHNKSGMDNAELHRRRGLCASPAEAPLRSDYVFLSQLLMKPVRQWTDGF